MKVGDLVRLSAYGMDRDYNNWITIVDPHQTGLIVQVANNVNATWPYKVKWLKSKKSLQPSHCRRELKFAYRPKNTNS